MRKVILTLAVLAVCSIAAAETRDTFTETSAANMTRSCIPAIGAVAIRLAATTGADADSGALDLGTTYMLRCDTAAWVRFGAAAVTAAANDWQVGAGEVFFIPTGGSENMRHISALSVTVTGDCRLLECR